MRIRLATMRKLTVRSLLCLSLTCTPLLSATHAFAAPARQTDDEATIAIARERFKEGVAFFDRKEFDKARVAFLQAYALKKHPAVLLNLAQSELRSNHEADAAKHFSAFLRESKEATDAEREAAEAGLSSAKNAIAEVTPHVDEPSVELFVDGAPEGVTPLSTPLYLAPGAHTLEARKGGKTTKTQVNATAGAQLSVTLTFAPKAPPVAEPAPSPVSEPTPEVEPEEPHVGRKPFFKWLVGSPVGVVGLGLTGVGLGVGVGTSLASSHAYKNADSVADQIKANAAADSGTMNPDTTSLCTDPEAWLTGHGYVQNNRTPALGVRVPQYVNACSQYPDHVHRGDTLKTIATVGFVVAGAAAVGTVIYYFVDPSAREGAKEAGGPRRRIALVPNLGPTETGLSVVGSF